jgi:hypothetical protein
MKKNEINEFIERMEEIGDVWTPEQVESVYADVDLDEALKKRQGEISIFGSIIGTILNNKNK